MAPSRDTVPPQYTDADYYGFFLLDLFDLIEDARKARWDSVGIDLLCRGRDRFTAEFRERWPHEPIPEAEAGVEGGGCDGAHLLNALSGAEDSAAMSGADQDGLEMLREAIIFFLGQLRRQNVDV